MYNTKIRHGGVRMVVGFASIYMQSVSITNKPISSISTSKKVYSIQLYVRNCVRSVVFSMFSCFPYN